MVPRKLGALELAFVSAGGLLAAAGIGWAAHGLMGSDAEQATRSAAASSPTPIVQPSTSDPELPERVRVVTEEGVTLEDTGLVREFLDLSVRCGMRRGTEYRANLFDLLRLRSLDRTTFQFDYEVALNQDSGYKYITIKERNRLKGKPFPGLPGKIIYTYYFDEARGNFSLIDKSPDGPGVDEQSLQLQQDPLSFLTFHWEAVCNNKLILERQPPRRIATRSHPVSPVAARPEVGMSQWADDQAPTASQNNSTPRQ